MGLGTWGAGHGRGASGLAQGPWAGAPCTGCPAPGQGGQRRSGSRQPLSSVTGSGACRRPPFNPRGAQTQRLRLPGCHAAPHRTSSRAALISARHSYSVTLSTWGAPFIAISSPSSGVCFGGSGRGGEKYDSMGAAVGGGGRQMCGQLVRSRWPAARAGPPAAAHTPLDRRGPAPAACPPHTPPLPRRHAPAAPGV